MNQCWFLNCENIATLNKSIHRTCTEHKNIMCGCYICCKRRCKYCDKDGTQQKYLKGLKIMSNEWYCDEHINKDDGMCSLC